MKAIVATDMCWNIGKDGNLLFHIPEDMKFFKEKTTGKVVVMGRKTLESLPNGEPLKDRTNIVLSNNTTEQNITSQWHGYFKGNKDYVDKMLLKFIPDNVFIIGGESVYNLYLHQCDTVYRTVLNEIFEADKKFPILSAEHFKRVNILSEGLHKGAKWYIEEWINTDL